MVVGVAKKEGLSSPAITTTIFGWVSTAVFMMIIAGFSWSFWSSADELEARSL